MSWVPQSLRLGRPSQCSAVTMAIRSHPARLYSRRDALTHTHRLIIGGESACVVSIPAAWRAASIRSSSRRKLMRQLDGGSSSSDSVIPSWMTRAYRASKSALTSWASRLACSIKAVTFMAGDLRWQTRKPCARAEPGTVTNKRQGLHAGVTGLYLIPSPPCLPIWTQPAQFERAFFSSGGGQPTITVTTSKNTTRGQLRFGPLSCRPAAPAHAQD
jgi:hypothetical protein